MTSGRIGTVITLFGTIMATSVDATAMIRDAAAIITGEMIAGRIEAIIGVPLTPALFLLKAT